MNNSKLYSAEIDTHGALLFESENVSGIGQNQKVYAPISAINITKNLDVIVNPKYLFANISSKRNFLEVVSSRNNWYTLKDQQDLIERVNSFKYFLNLPITQKFVIKQKGNNLINATQVFDDIFRNTGPRNIAKLSVLSNTALYHEEYELAMIANKAIDNILSSKYISIPSRKSTYQALLPR